MSVKLTQMRHFVALSEELHFGRAASKLGIAQPPLSQSISRLEAFLGFGLINRGRGGLSLTPAGEIFAREARLVLRQAEFLERTTRRAATGAVEELSVGFVEPALFQLVPAALLHFHKQTDGVRLVLDEYPSAIQVGMLQRGELDLGIFLPAPTAVPGLEMRIVETCQLLACVPASSPLANRDSVRLMDLADETFIMHPMTLRPSRDDLLVAYRQSGLVPRVEQQFILAACRQAGFEPRIERQSLRTLAMISLIAAGMGVGFVPDSARRRPFEGVAYLPVSDLSGIQRQLMIGWRTGEIPSALQELIDVLSVVDMEARSPADTERADEPNA